MIRIWRSAWRTAYRWRMQAYADVHGPVLDYKHYDTDGMCHTCPVCGAGRGYHSERVTDSMEHIVMETESTCTVCGLTLNRWAHGMYDHLLSHFWPRHPVPVLSTVVDRMPMRTITN